VFVSFIFQIGETALFPALHHRRWDVADLLLRRGCDFRAKDMVVNCSMLSILFLYDLMDWSNFVD
jgi:hypothetical protein